MKYSILSISTALALGLSGFWISTVQASSITITDSRQNQVVIPEKITRIADAWPAHNEILAMLGAGNEIVATVHSPQTRPWLYKISPKMKQAKTVFHYGASASLEELMSTKPDIIFTTMMDNSAQKMSSIGIPTVQLEFHDYPSMEKCITLTAKILGGDAINRAAAYNAYLESKIDQISKITAAIPDAKKPKVLHISATNPLIVDGKKTIIDQWIKLAGGINVATNVPGAMKGASLEQIVAWNPDIIIVGADSKNFKDILAANPAWAKITAVKQHHIFYNPDGAFLWDRYGAEEALQIQWAAKVMHPAQFKYINIDHETKYFYKNFLNYSLTNQETNNILKTDVNPVI